MNKAIAWYYALMFSFVVVSFAVTFACRLFVWPTH